jgi:hypothetical protein
MLKFFEDHKGWIAAHVGVAAVVFAPKLGITPEEFTTAAITIGTIVSTYVGSHNYQKSKAAQP